MRPIHQPVYQGAKNLWGELFKYCSDDASVFSRYKRRCYFQNSDLFGAQRMLLRRIPICHFIAAAITPANRFYWVREHELVQIILHRPNADVKFHSQIRGRVKAPAQQSMLAILRTDALLLLLGQIPWQIQDTRQRHCLIAFLKGHSSAAFADVSRMAFA